LINGKDLDKPDEEGNLKISPDFCSINKRSNGDTKTLKHEPGIPELKHLYYDVYDYDQGGFKKMSPEMQKEYDEDVKRFYIEFTGSKDVPENIKNFSDIKLREFHKSKGCSEGGVYTKGYTGSIKEKLFELYAEQTKTMMENANTSQDKLLEILDELFVFSFDSVEKTKKIVINPTLKEKDLQELIDKARKIIIELYLTCEQDFVKALEVYEAIVEKQMLDTTKKQIASMGETRDDVNVPKQSSQTEPIGPPEHERPAENEIKHTEEPKQLPPVEAPIPEQAVTGDVAPQNAEPKQNGNGNGNKQNGNKQNGNRNGL
jgi:hypothetical protein